MRCFNFSQDDLSIFKDLEEQNPDKWYQISSGERVGEVTLTENLADSREGNMSLRKKLFILFLSFINVYNTTYIKTFIKSKRLRSFNIFCGLAQIIRKGDMIYILL